MAKSGSSNPVQKPVDLKKLFGVMLVNSVLVLIKANCWLFTTTGCFPLFAEAILLSEAVVFVGPSSTLITISPEEIRL